MALEGTLRVRIEGARPVIEAIRAGRRGVLEVTLPTGASRPALAELEQAVREAGIPVRRGEPGEPVSAVAEPFPEETLEQVLVDARPRFLVALDRVTDVGNLGSIARSAEAAGATALVLEHRRAPALGPGVLRASAGAIEHLRVARTPNLGRGLRLAGREGLAVLVAEAGGRPLAELDAELLVGELVWVFGSEDRGTRQRLRQLATHVVGIPLEGAVKALNVASAAAYLLLRTAELRRKVPLA